MLSRRNIRIKVMQSLYALNRDKALDLPTALRNYHTAINDSYRLYLFNLLQIADLAEYNLKDEKKRASKHLPTEEDKAFQPRLVRNSLIQFLIKCKPLNEAYEEVSALSDLDENTSRILYSSFSQTREFLDYTFENKSVSDQDFLLQLYKYICSNEAFTDHMDDRFASWLDDKSLVIGAVKKSIKALPSSETFFEEYKPDQETIADFGETLLKNTYNENEELLAMISPTLKNWDPERVSIIDMILLKMAITELMTFESIPTKVSLNEYLEIAKTYSSAKSKDFINGILDRMMKTLEKEGKIVKKGRGLVG